MHDMQNVSESFINGGLCGSIFSVETVQQNMIGNIIAGVQIYLRALLLCKQETLCPRLSVSPWRILWNISGKMEFGAAAWVRISEFAFMSHASAMK